MPLPSNEDDEVCRAVYSALRALEARFGMMERAMEMQEKVRPAAGLPLEAAQCRC